MLWHECRTSQPCTGDYLIVPRRRKEDADRRDFVREPGQPFVRRHIPMEYQNKYLKPVAKLDDLVRKQACERSENAGSRVTLRVEMTASNSCRIPVFKYMFYKC